MLLTIFLIFTIVWLFWQNTKLYRATQILLEEIGKRDKSIKDAEHDLDKGTIQFNELTKKYNKLAKNHNEYVKAKKKGGDDCFKIQISDN